VAPNLRYAQAITDGRLLQRRARYIHLHHEIRHRAPTVEIQVALVRGEVAHATNGIAEVEALGGLGAAWEILPLERGRTRVEYVRVGPSARSSTRVAMLRLTSSCRWTGSRSQAPPVVEEARRTTLLALRQQPHVSLPASVGQEDMVLLTVLQRAGRAYSSTSVNRTLTLVREFTAVNAGWLSAR